MRPLPTLEPLQPSPDVYTPATDGFDQLLGGDMANFDALQSLLQSGADSLFSAGTDLHTTLDTIGGIFDGIDQTFAHLDSSLAQLDYSSTIAEVEALDKSFAGNVANYTTDLGGAVAALTQLFSDFFNNVVLPFVEYIAALILQVVMALIAQILDMILGLLAMLGL